MRFILALIAALAVGACMTKPIQAAPKAGTVLELGAYCKTEADAQKFVDVLLTRDNDAYRAFIADSTNTCVVLAAVGRPPVRAILISVKKYKDGVLIAKLRVGKDIIYSFGRE